MEGHTGEPQLPQEQPMGEFLPHPGEPAEHPIDVAYDGGEAHPVDVSSIGVMSAPEVPAMQQASETSEQSDPAVLAQEEPVDEPRWDITKAETIGAATKEDIGETVDDKNADKQEYVDGSYIQKATARERFNVAAVQPDIDSTEADKQQSELLEATARATDEAAQLASEVDDTHEEIINKHLSAFEELYDTNPEAFADMKTPDFMQAAAELQDRDRQIDFEADKVNTLEVDLQKFQDAISARQFASKDMVASLSSNIELAFSFNEADTAALNEEVASISDDSFDKSQRQIMEGYVATINKYIEKAKLDQQKAVQDRQAFIDQFKPGANQEHHDQ